MFRFILAIFFTVSISAPAKAEFSLSDDAITYTTFSIGLILKNTLSHQSKRLAVPRPTASVLLRCLSDGTGLFLLKETGDFVLQSFKDVAPEWLKGKKNTSLETENKELKQQLEDFKRASLATNGQLQAERIKEIKEKLLAVLLEHVFSEINQVLDAPQQWFSTADHSMKITTLLSQLSEQVLDLYPGHAADPNKTLTETGESHFYNEQLIRGLAQNFHLKSRIPANVLVYLKENLQQFVQNNQRPKAEYFKHFFGLLGIDIELPEFTTELDKAPQTPDL